MNPPFSLGSKDLRPPRSPVQAPQLKATNDWRRIRKQCMPLFDVAAGKPETVQSSVYVTMTLMIAETLGVEARSIDLVAHPEPGQIYISGVPLFTDPNHAAWMRLLADVENAAVRECPERSEL